MTWKVIKYWLICDYGRRESYGYLEVRNNESLEVVRIEGFLAVSRWMTEGVSRNLTDMEMEALHRLSMAEENLPGPVEGS